MRQYKIPSLLMSILMIVVFAHQTKFVNPPDVASGHSFAGELVLLPTDKIVTNNGGASDNFGYSVDMNGHTLVGGAAFAEVDGIP